MNTKSRKSHSGTPPEICRLCLAPSATHFSLTEDTKISTMLEALTSLRISPLDDISTVTCLKCLLNLKLAFTIQQNMLKAEQRFRELRTSTPVKQEQDRGNTQPKERQSQPEQTTQVEPKTEECVCDVCGKKWPSKVDLGKHKRAVHVQVDCLICGKTFKKGSIKRHMDDKHATDGQSFTCDVCGVEKTSKLSLYKHKHCVHKLSKCTICDKEVKSVSLKKHVATHNAPTEAAKAVNGDKLVTNLQKEYVCDICGKVKFSKSSLNAHKYSVHVEGECPICKKRISQVNLKRHIERHSDCHIVCDLCGISVLQQDLRVHRYNVHTVRQLKCNFCEKIFKKNYSRTMHEKREHLDEANFTCDTCGKRFYQNVFLKKHIESKHLKKRPHVCEFCKVGFSSKFALKTHIRQHTNEKPFKCEFCGDGFRQKVSLKSHLRSQHDVEEELICECKVCGKRFASAIALLSHKRIH